MVKKALISTVLSLIITYPAQAQDNVNSCQEFAQTVLNKYAVIKKTLPTNDDKLTKVQSVEVKELLEEACSPKFSQCGFNFCINEKLPTTAPIALDTSSTVPTSEAAATQDSEPHLQWVTESMSCEDFLGQIRTKYRPGDKNEVKKKELQSALKLACSERFKQCNFEVCKKIRK